MKKIVIVGLSLLCAIGLIYIGSQYREIPAFLKTDLASNGAIMISDVTMDVDKKLISFEVILFSEDEKALQEDMCFKNYDITINAIDDSGSYFVIYELQNVDISKSRSFELTVDDKVFTLYKDSSEENRKELDFNISATEGNGGGLGMSRGVYLVGDGIDDTEPAGWQ